MTTTQGGSATNSAPVAPPTPQEISRKLSVHQKPTKARTITAPAVSGTESDSDSILSPDLSPLLPHSSGGHFPGNTTQQPLSSIAERDSASGDESYEDDEDEGIEWRSGGGKPRAHEDSVIKAGYLWKKGERRKTWKKRWFVLRPAHLAFYQSSAEYQLLRLLELSDVHACTQVSLKRHANSFGVVSPTRTYYLQAQSPEDVQDWIHKLNQAREVLMSTSTQNSVATAPIAIPRSPKTSTQPYTTTPSPPNHAAVTSESESDDPISNQPASYQSQIVTFSPSKGPTVSKDPTKTILTGYLMKCRSRGRTWRKRWFVLTGEKLVYSASHMEPKRQRSIDLTQIVDALECDLPAHKHSGHLSQSPMSPSASSSGPKAPENDDGSQGKHTFKIITAKRSLLLCAPSEEEEIKWLSAVRALIARRSGPNSVGSPPTNSSVGANPSAIRATVSSSGALGNAGPSESQHVQSGSGHSRKRSVTGRTRSASGASFGPETTVSAEKR